MFSVIADGVNSLFGVAKVDFGMMREPDEGRARNAAVRLKCVGDARRGVGQQPLESADLYERLKAHFFQGSVKNRLVGPLANDLRCEHVKRPNAVAKTRPFEKYFKKLPMRLGLP